MPNQIRLNLNSDDSQEEITIDKRDIILDLPFEKEVITGTKNWEVKPENSILLPGSYKA